MRAAAGALLVVAGACNSSAVVFVGDGGTGAGACGLASPAFCETFEVVRPGGRGGDLDETRWSFARWGHQVQYLWERAPASTYTDGHLFPSTFCGAAFSGILPDDDAKICDGPALGGGTSRQLNEVFDDQGDYGVSSMRIRQPFDFTDREGKIVWDVDAKVNPLNVGHGWWFELWITADPAPMPHHQAPGVLSFPRQGVGFAFQFGADCPEDVTTWRNGLETIFVTDGYQIVHQIPFYSIEELPQRCFLVADGVLNHFELRISRDRAELWASDAGDPASLAQRAVVAPLDLPFTRGYVHLQHGQFNAALDGNVTPSQTFRWDNVGFDGPILPTPRGYDVPDPGTPGQGGAVRIGWFPGEGPQTFTLRGVDLSGASGATLSFMLDGLPGLQLDYQLNGGPTHTLAYPETTAYAGQGGVHGFSADVPLAELVRGDNTLVMSLPAPGSSVHEGIGSIDLTVATQP